MMMMVERKIERNFENPCNLFLNLCIPHDFKRRILSSILYTVTLQIFFVAFRENLLKVTKFPQLCYLKTEKNFFFFLLTEHFLQRFKGDIIHFLSRKELFRIEIEKPEVGIKFK